MLALGALAMAACGSDAEVEALQEELDELNATLDAQQQDVDSESATETDPAGDIVPSEEQPVLELTPTIEPVAPPVAVNCTAVDFGAPGLVQPANGLSIDTLTPSLQWVYGPAGACTPERYNVVVGIQPDLSGLNQSGVLLHPFTEWTVTPALASDTVYYWRVAVLLDDTSTGAWSEIWSFRTPPSVAATCTADDFGPPGLVQPANGLSIDTLTPTLQWVYGAGSPCTPERYHIEVGIAPDLSGLNHSGVLSHPIMEWTPNSALAPDTIYYWRVSVLLDDLSAAAWSDIWSFRTPS